MKHKIKKNRLKIFIALSLMITCIFGIMFATNTFAYTYNETTNTIISDNIWDEQWELGTIENNGQIGESTTKFRSKNFQVCMSNTQYYSYNGNPQEPYIFWYDENYNFISFIYSPNRIITSPNNAHYFKIRENGTTYNHDICINISNPRINGTYEPYGTFINETLYNELEDNYEELDTDYFQLNNDYTQLESDYNDLDEDYTQLQNDYNELNGTNTNGIWSLFNGFRIMAYNGQDIQNATTIQDTVDFDTFNANGYINGIDIDITNAKTNNPNYDNYLFIAYYNNNANDVNYTLKDIYLKIPNGNINNFGIQTFNSIYLQTNIILNANQLQEINFDINYNNIVNVSEYYNNDTKVYALIFNFIGTNNDNYIVRSTNNQYTIGYVNGFQNGYNSRNTTISYYNTIVEEQTQRINTLQREINILNGQIRTLTNDNYSLNNLMWTIGSVPFESFKQIWNVNFFGVNLADFFLGFVTFFIALFVVKKFFL